MKHIKNFRPLALAAILMVTSAAAAVCGLVRRDSCETMWAAMTTSGPSPCPF